LAFKYLSCVVQKVGLKDFIKPNCFLKN